MCTVRRILLIKRQERLRKYWTNISCFGGKVWISMDAVARLSNRLARLIMEIIA